MQDVNFELTQVRIADLGVGPKQKIYSSTIDLYAILNAEYEERINRGETRFEMPVVVNSKSYNAYIDFIKGSSQYDTPDSFELSIRGQSDITWIQVHSKDTTIRSGTNEHVYNVFYGEVVDNGSNFNFSGTWKIQVSRENEKVPVEKNYKRFVKPGEIGKEGDWYRFYHEYVNQDIYVNMRYQDSNILGNPSTGNNTGQEWHTTVNGWTDLNIKSGRYIPILLVPEMLLAPSEVNTYMIVNAKDKNGKIERIYGGDIREKLYSIDGGYNQATGQVTNDLIVSTYDFDINKNPINKTTAARLSPSDYVAFQVYFTDPTAVPKSTVDDLPLTEKSIFTQNVKKTDLGYATFEHLGNNKVEVNISVNNKSYSLEFLFDDITDMSIFNSQNATHYYTHEKEKFLIISHGQKSMFTDVADTFIPYTIWNLTTNELMEINRFKAYMYSQMEAANNAYAYFYVDDFLIEHLLNISLNYEYRYIDLLGNEKSWQQESVLLESDKVADNINPLGWQGAFLSYAAVGTAVLSQVPYVRWPAIAVGSLSMWLVGRTIKDNILQLGSVSQIQEVSNPSDTLVNKLNAEYRKKDPTFNGINQGFKVFKLHLGQFNKAFMKGIELNEKYSTVPGQEGINVVEFTYQTNGKIYTMKGDSIDVILTPGPGTGGSDTPKAKDMIFAGIVVVIVGFYILTGVRNNGFTAKKIVSHTLIYAFVLGLALFIYYFVVLDYLLINLVLRL